MLQEIIRPSRISVTALSRSILISLVCCAAILSPLTANPSITRDYLSAEAVAIATSSDVDSIVYKNALQPLGLMKPYHGEPLARVTFALSLILRSVVVRDDAIGIVDARAIPTLHHKMREWAIPPKRF